MKLEICGHRILIRPDSIEKISKGGIILAQNEKREQAAQTTGTVVSVGPMAWKAFDGKDPKWKPWANVGDHVLYTRYGGRYTKDPDNSDGELIIINDEDILAVIKD